MSVTLLWTMINQFDDEENWIFGLAVFASVGSLAKWCCCFGLLVTAEGDIADFAQEKTDLKQLYFQKQWTQLSEIITFKINDIQIACCALFVEFPYHSPSLLYIHFDCIFITDSGWMEEIFVD